MVRENAKKRYYGACVPVLTLPSYWLVRRLRWRRRETAHFDVDVNFHTRNCFGGQGGEGFYARARCGCCCGWGA